MNNVDKIIEFNKIYEEELINRNNARVNFINSLNKIVEMGSKMNYQEKQLCNNIYHISRLLKASKILFSEDEIKCLRFVYEKDGKNEK